MGACEKQFFRETTTFGLARAVEPANSEGGSKHKMHIFLSYQ